LIRDFATCFVLPIFSFTAQLSPSKRKATSESGETSSRKRDKRSADTFPAVKPAEHFTLQATVEHAALPEIEMQVALHSPAEQRVAHLQPAMHAAHVTLPATVEHAALPELPSVVEHYGTNHEEDVSIDIESIPLRNACWLDTTLFHSPESTDDPFPIGRGGECCIRYQID
jgi:hypothetical protein